MVLDRQRDLRQEGRPVSQLEIEVYSNPLIALNPNSPMWDIKSYPSLPQYDAELLKPALIFGDHVNLVTFSETMRDMVYSQAKTLYVMPMVRAAHFVQVSRRRDPRELETLGVTLGQLPTQEQIEEDWESFSRGDLNFIREYDELIETVSQNAIRVWAKRFEELEGKELGPAITSGRLSVEGWTPPIEKHGMASVGLNVEETEFWSYDEFVARLGSSNKQLMLDAGASWIAENWRSPHYQKRRAVADKAGNWRLTSVLVARQMVTLPGLERLTIAEILDLRRELEEYLPAFRSEVFHLGEDIANADEMTQEEVSLELERRWHRDVAPAVMEIRQQIAAASYPRHLLNAVTTEKGSLAALAGAFALGAGSLAAGVSALLPAAAAAAYPFAKALNETLSARREARRSRLYFLYKLGKGIERRLK